MNNGQIEAAYDTLKEGCQTFPSSEKLRGLFENTRARRLRSQIAALTSSIENSPTPPKYAALVDAYLEDGNRVAARQACTEGLSKFPNDAELCMRMGECCLRLFLEGGLARDAETAIEHFDKCLLRSPRNRRAVLGLLEIYTAIGANNLAIRLFADAIESERLQHLYRRVIANLSLPESDVKQLLWEYERAHTTGEHDPAVLKPDAGPSPASQTLVSVIEKLSSIAGHMASILLDQNGGVLQCSITGELNRNELAKAMAEIAMVSKNCSARFGIGILQDEEINGPSGNVFVKAIGGSTLFVLTHRSARRSEITAQLARLDVPA